MYSVIVDDRLQKFLQKLDDAILGKMIRSFDLLEKYGGNLGMPHTKYIEKDLYELRLPGHRTVRFFYTVQDKNVILFYGFFKKTMRIPKDDLRVAQQIVRSLAKK